MKMILDPVNGLHHGDTWDLTKHLAKRVNKPKTKRVERVHYSYESGSDDEDDKNDPDYA